MRKPEKLLGYCMILLGATMIFSIFAAGLSVILYLFGGLTLIYAVSSVLFALIVNSSGYLIERRLEKNYAKT